MPDHDLRIRRASRQVTIRQSIQHGRYAHDMTWESKNKVQFVTADSRMFNS
jgi:hypothetical protein